MRLPDTYLSYNDNSITFLSFVAKDGVNFNKHLLHRGKMPAASLLIAGGTLVVIWESPNPTTGIIRVVNHAYL